MKQSGWRLGKVAVYDEENLSIKEWSDIMKEKKLIDDLLNCNGNQADGALQEEQHRRNKNKNYHDDELAFIEEWLAKPMYADIHIICCIDVAMYVDIHIICCTQVAEI